MLPDLNSYITALRRGGLVGLRWTKFRSVTLRLSDGSSSCLPCSQEAPVTVITVVLMGLDSSGKTTLLARLLRGQVADTSPTIGFNVGTLNLDKNLSLTLWDVGGQKGMRPNWTLYLDDCKALVFVVDSNDPGRLPEAQNALKKVLSDERLRDVPLMVLANKNDLPSALSIEEISTQLNLPSYSKRSWEIQACSALKGLGLQQAFLSVSTMIKKG